MVFLFVLLIEFFLVSEIKTFNLNDERENDAGPVPQTNNISNEMVFQSYPQFQIHNGNF